MNASGQKDTSEFINIAKDDALAWPKQACRAYPPTVNARMESTIVPFVRKSLEVNDTLIGIFNDKLGLPDGALQKRHLMDEPSCCEARCIKIPPNPDDQHTALGAHTDFGSLVLNFLLTNNIY